MLNKLRKWLPCLSAIGWYCCFVGAPIALAQNFPPVRLSLNEALKMAIANSAVTKGADARVLAAAAKHRGTSVPLSPTVSIAHGAGRDTGGLDEDILVTQVFQIGRKFGQHLSEARAERDAAIAERAAKAAELEFNVRSSYFASARTEEELSLAANALANAQNFLKAAETQFQAGDVPRSNVLRSQIELSRAEQALSAAETERDNQLSTLKSLIGASPDTPISLSDPLGFEPRQFSLEALRDYASTHRFDIVAAKRTLDAKRAALSAANALSLPDMFLEGRHAIIDRYPDGNSIRAGITFSPFDLGRNRAEVQAARAAMQEQEFVVKETTRVALLEVETAIRDLNQARKTVESFKAGRLERSKELLAMAQLGYQRGANTYIELLDAQQVYRTEQADYTRALAAYNTALAALRKAVGGTLP